MMNEDQAIQFLKEECNKAGSRMAWAQAHGFSAAFISQVLMRQRALTDRLLEQLNLTRIVQYVRK